MVEPWQRTRSSTFEIQSLLEVPSCASTFEVRGPLEVSSCAGSLLVTCSPAVVEFVSADGSSTVLLIVRVFQVVDPLQLAHG